MERNVSNIVPKVSSSGEGHMRRSMLGVRDLGEEGRELNLL